MQMQMQTAIAATLAGYAWLSLVTEQQMTIYVCAAMTEHVDRQLLLSD